MRNELLDAGADVVVVSRINEALCAARKRRFRAGVRDWSLLAGTLILAAGCGTSSRSTDGNAPAAGTGGVSGVQADTEPNVPMIGTIGGAGNESGGGWRHAVEVLPIEAETGTVPTRVSLRLLDLPSGSFEAIWVGSRITHIGSTAGYASDCATHEVRVVPSGPGSSDSIVATSGDVVTLPLVHTVTLDPGVYSDQIMVETWLSWSDAGVQDGGDRPFEVTDGSIVPMTQEQYDAAAEAACRVMDCMGAPDLDAPVEHAGECKTPSWR